MKAGRFSGLDRAGVQRLAAELARTLAQALERGQARSVTVGLVGELGAGKTTFAQGFVAALEGGDRAHVTSPTYAILQVYETRPVVRHVDLYRIDTVEELDALGYSELLDAPGLDLVEWMRQIPDAIPPEWVEVTLEARADDLRDVHIHAHGARVARFL